MWPLLKLDLCPIQPYSALPCPTLPSTPHTASIANAVDRRYFGDDEEAFRAAVDWQHQRLLQATTAETDIDEIPAPPAAALNGDGLLRKGGNQQSDRVDGGGGAGWGTFVVFSSHGEGRRAREALETALSPSSVMTVAHNRRHGACFLVHANLSVADALLLLDNGQGAQNKGDSVGSAGGGTGGWLFEGFIALPSALKVSPTLLDHGIGSSFDGRGNINSSSGSNIAEGGDHYSMAAGPSEPATAATSGTSGEEEPLLTTPGKALSKEGIVVLLSPGSLSPLLNGDEDERAVATAALAERWRQELSSASLDLHGTSFWSDTQGPVGGAAATVGLRDGGSAERSSAPGTTTTVAASARVAELLGREWVRAAQIVHSMAERGGVTPAEACGWDSLRFDSEGPDLMTVRGELGGGFFVFRRSVC